MLRLCENPHLVTRRPPELSFHLGERIFVAKDQLIWACVAQAFLPTPAPTRSRSKIFFPVQLEVHADTWKILLCFLNHLIFIKEWASIPLAFSLVSSLCNFDSRPVLTSGLAALSLRYTPYRTTITSYGPFHRSHHRYFGRALHCPSLRRDLLALLPKTSNQEVVALLLSFFFLPLYPLAHAFFPFSRC
jgi:hypothetical protein